MPEEAGEVGCRDDVDAVVGAARAGFDAYHDPADAGVFLGQDAESLEVWWLLIRALAFASIAMRMSPITKSTSMPLGSLQ